MHIYSEFSILLLLMMSTVFAQDAGGNDQPGKTDDDLVFIKIGNFSGTDSCELDYFKEYYIPRHFKAHWYQVRNICEAHGFKSLSLEIREESDALLGFLEPYKYKTPTCFYIGGMTLSLRNKEDWYWISYGNKITFDLTWNNGQPDGWSQPMLDRERCLAISRDDAAGTIGFNDVFCNKYRAEKFVCQTHTIFDEDRTEE